jgi:hypothetical protein
VLIYAVSVSNGGRRPIPRVSVESPGTLSQGFGLRAGRTRFENIQGEKLAVGAPSLAIPRTDLRGWRADVRPTARMRDPTSYQISEWR